MWLREMLTHILYGNIFDSQFLTLTALSFATFNHKKFQ